MITDNETFYLCTIKDIQNVLKKDKRMRDFNVLKFMSKRPVWFFDEKGVAYWAIPFSAPNPHDIEIWSKTYEQSVLYFIERLKFVSDDSHYPFFRVKGYGLD